MVWVYLALLIPASFLILAHLLKFRFTIEYQTPAHVQTKFGVYFLGYKREISSRPEKKKPGNVAEDFLPNLGSLQSGFIRIPEFEFPKLTSLKIKFSQAWIRFVLDIPTWLALLGYLLTSGKRVLRLLHPKFEHLHFGWQEILSLGRFAAFWSVLTGMFPSLACPIEYQFNQKPASGKMGLGMGFSGLNLLIFLGISLFAFPWLKLLSRFWFCWRNPSLNQWQRLLLLF